MVSEAIAKGDVAALNYFIADKYIKAFGQIANSPNQKVIMLPMEATSILASLAGIGEIAKATFGESAASPPRLRRADGWRYRAERRGRSRAKLPSSRWRAKQAVGPQRRPIPPPYPPRK